MEAGMVGKIEKAKRYAQERQRFQFHKFDLKFHGDNNDHRVTFEEGKFNCDCEFFVLHRHCAHTMALENLLKDMIPQTVEA
jgi:hypothetical protein